VELEEAVLVVGDVGKGLPVDNFEYSRADFKVVPVCLTAALLCRM
jgi:hypothetical protein